MGKKRTDPRLLRKARKGRQRRWGKRAHNPTTEYYPHTVRYGRRANGYGEGISGRIEGRIERATIGELKAKSFDLDVKEEPTLTERIEAAKAQQEYVSEKQKQVDWKTWFAGFKRMRMSNALEIDMVFSGEEFYFIKPTGNGRMIRSIQYRGLTRARQVFYMNKISWVEVY